MWQVLLNAPWDWADLTGVKMNGDDKELLWRYRYALIKEPKALTKCLICVDWSDQHEVCIYPFVVLLSFFGRVADRGLTIATGAGGPGSGPACRVGEDEHHRHQRRFANAFGRFHAPQGSHGCCAAHSSG